VAKTETRTGRALAGWFAGTGKRKKKEPVAYREGKGAVVAPAFAANAHAIQVVHAREHNLKEVSTSIPHGKIVVVTGPSGSGKSTLRLDVVLADGDGRFLGHV